MKAAALDIGGAPLDPRGIALATLAASHELLRGLTDVGGEQRKTVQECECARSRRVSPAS